MLRRLLRSWTCLLAALLVVLLAPSASAADKVDRLIRELKQNDDFRVRTQAALALGASKTKRAVAPLCRGLEDSSATVRAASAAALGRLKKGGKTCLEKRLDDESSGAVKSSIKKALAKMEKAAEPTITSSTRYYVAIGKIVDKSGRNGGAVAKIVKEAMSKAAGDLEGYALAPDGESTAQAKKRLAKYKKLKAFLLSPTIQKPKYTDGNLTIKVEVVIFTYPGKALKGTIPVKLTQQDVPSKDTSSEDELIKMASARAMEKFSENVERIE